MKKQALAAALLLSASAIQAQNNTWQAPAGTSSLWEQFLDNLSDYDDIEAGSTEEMYEELRELETNPIDLNNATDDDIQRLAFLSNAQREELTEYLDRHRPVRSIGELAMIKSLDNVTLQLLSSFVYVGSIDESRKFPTWKEIAKHGKNELVGYVKIPFYERKGDREAYLGYKYKHWIRYKYSYGQLLQAGITGAQDAGEPFFGSHNKMGYDHYAPVIEESIIADLLETGGEHMQQETPDKLFVAESDLPFRITGFPAPCREDNLCFRDGKDPAVGDCDLVGIAPQIFDGVTKAVEGLLDVRAPVFSIKAVFELLPDAVLLQFPAGGRKNKFLLLMQSLQEGEIFSLKLIPEDSDRDEKLCGRLPDPAVRSKASPGDDTVHMDMIVQFLVPGVEHLDDPGLCPKVFFVGRQFQKSFGTAFMEQPVKKLLITVDQRVEFVWKCKHHMEVRGVNDFRPAFINPDLFQDSLTVGTVAVAAGIIVELHVSAFPALADIDAKPAGLAGEDRAGSFSLFIRLEMSGLTVILIGILPYLLDLEVTQWNHLRSGQKERIHFWPGKKPDGYR